jgi:hypothetical protein
VGDSRSMRRLYFKHRVDQPTARRRRQVRPHSPPDGDCTQRRPTAPDVPDVPKTLEQIVDRQHFVASGATPCLHICSLAVGAAQTSDHYKIDLGRSTLELGDPLLDHRVSAMVGLDR